MLHDTMVVHDRNLDPLSVIKRNFLSNWISNWVETSKFRFIDISYTFLLNFNFIPVYLVYYLFVSKVEIPWWQKSSAEIRDTFPKTEPKVENKNLTKQAKIWSKIIFVKSEFMLDSSSSKSAEPIRKVLCRIRKALFYLLILVPTQFLSWNHELGLKRCVMMFSLRLKQKQNFLLLVFVSNLNWTIRVFDFLINIFYFSTGYNLLNFRHQIINTVSDDAELFPF